MLLVAAAVIGWTSQGLLAGCTIHPLTGPKGVVRLLHLWGWCFSKIPVRLDWLVVISNGFAGPDGETRETILEGSLPSLLHDTAPLHLNMPRAAGVAADDDMAFIYCPAPFRLCLVVLPLSSVKK